MALNPPEEFGMPVTDQFRHWRGLNIDPFAPPEVQPYTRTRVIQMNGIEVESIGRAQLGGEPGYVSSAEQAVRAMGDATLQSTFLTSGGLDVMAAEMVMRDAVLVAETIEHANWEGVKARADSAPSGPVSDALREAYDASAPTRTSTWSGPAPCACA